MKARNLLLVFVSFFILGIIVYNFHAEAQKAGGTALKGQVADASAQPISKAAVYLIPASDIEVMAKTKIEIKRDSKNDEPLEDNLAANKDKYTKAVTDAKGNFKIAKFKRPSPEVALIFIWSIVPILISSIYAKVFTSRYILFSLPTIYIFASLVFVDIYSRERLFNKVLIFGLIIYTLQSLLLNYYLLTDPEKASLPRDARSGFLEEWTAGTGIREISEFVREEYQKNPDVKIVIGTEGYFGTLPDGLQLYLNDLPEIIVIGTGLDFKEVPIQLIESKESGNKTYFVVNSSRLKASPCALGLKLIAAYPKAVKPDKSRETLYFFEVK